MLVQLLSCSAQEQLAVNLWKAVKDDDLGEVRSLLGQGANPNHQLYWSEEWIIHKRPPVHTACMKGNLEITRALVSGGADVERAGGDYGMKPFHCACEGGNKDIVLYLSQDIKCRIGKCVLYNSRIV